MASSGDLDVEAGSAVRVDGEISGDVAVRERGIAQINGSVSGDVLVEPGAQIKIVGELNGSLHVRAGGVAFVAGCVHGDALIEGGLMVRNGMVNGDLAVRPGGELVSG